MISDEADKVIKKLFDSLKDRYQNNSQRLDLILSVSNLIELFWLYLSFAF